METPAPTLAANWSPTSPGCLRTSEYWIWDYMAVDDKKTVLGGPSQITECFASTWQATVTYAGSACPVYYTSACHDTDHGVVTCCPSVYSFTCPTLSLGAYHHANQFRCVSKYTDEGEVTVTRTNFLSDQLSIERQSKHTYEHLYALALLYTTPGPTSVSPTSSSPKSLSTSPRETSFDSGESNYVGKLVGVGIGSAVFMLIIVGLIFFIYRRRVGAAAKWPGPLTDLPHYEAPALRRLAYTRVTEDSQNPTVLPSSQSPEELFANQMPPELDGSRVMQPTPTAQMVER
ncbi:hypothetical protein GGS21DRAFT_473077 [Xylaria nigripes]|nr:hypothetical protein GGS21DRAFT_473077 [Xylaria nigripes]